MPSETPIWIERADEAGTCVYFLQGPWRLAHAAPLDQQIRALPALPAVAGAACVLDGSRLQSLDTATGFLLLQRLQELGLSGEGIAMRAMRRQHAELLTLVRERMAAPDQTAPAKSLSMVRSIGAATLILAQTLRSHTAFVGQRCRHAPDGKTVSLVNVRHGHGAARNPGQHRHIHRLLE